MKPTASIGSSAMFKSLTLEQGRAVISGSKSVKVEAPAGSGKTFVMMGYAAARPKSKGLYLAFGKATQAEAAKRLAVMGVNTEARTQHSLAYATFGSVLARAGKLNGRSGLRPAVTANLLGVNYPMAAAINDTLKNFMNNPEPLICDAHLPTEADQKIVSVASGAVIDGARRMWARMVNPMDAEVQATDDVYLKQWVMTNPQLPYDFILFDEAQDANKLTAHLVNMQKHCTRVYVGDPHQSIYGFRGAVNLMDELEAEENHVLTTSFRFPANIGLLATAWLAHWKGKKTPIIGAGRGGPILDTDQTAYLSRTVAGLLAKGFELHSEGKKMHWVKGFEDYRTQTILDAYALFTGKSENILTIKDPTLKLMPSWSHFNQYVEEGGDGEVGPIFRLIEEYRKDAPVILEALRANQIIDSKDAKYVLTTGHKAKGLEWPIVRLTNDFFSFKDDSNNKKKKDRASSGQKPKTEWKSPDKIDEQEANLMYVMLTRAQKAIAPTGEVKEWFRTQDSVKHLFPEPKKRAENEPPHEQETQMERAA